MSARSLPAFASLLVFALVSLTNTVEAQKTWDGGGDSTSWTDAANWDPNGVPGASDNVVLTGGGTIQLGAGPITHCQPQLTSKTLEGTANITITGGFTWNGGQLRTSGTTNVGGLTTINVGTSHIIANGTLNLNGGGTWTDGTINMDGSAVLNLPSGQTLTVTDAAANGIFRFSVTAGETEPQFNLSGALTKAVGSTERDVD